MMSQPPVRTLVDPLRKLLRRGAHAHASNMLSKLHPADVARLMPHLDEEQRSEVFSMMLREDASRAADMISELSTDQAVELFEDMSDRRIAAVMAELSSDDAANLIPAMPEELSERILGLMEESESAPIEGLLTYEEETAGRIMNPDVFALE